MRLRDLARWVIGCLVLITAVAGTSYAGLTSTVPEPGAMTLTTVGLLVGGYLVGLVKARKK